jgi:FtsH-binding integral membrane protein
MDSSIILQQNQLYFNYQTPNEITRNFIRNMYFYLFKRTLFIHGFMYIPYFNYGELFFNSLCSGGLFVIFTYMLLISTALLYSNFNNYNESDMISYSYMLTICFSYILTYFTNYFDTQFYILNIHYLTILFASIFTYTNQIKYPYKYDNIIKISFSSQFILFVILTILYSNFEYILFTYLTSSLTTLYIIYNTENIITNELRIFPIKTDEYLSGSILLYLDIFNIFPHFKKTFTELI